MQDISSLFFIVLACTSVVHTFAAQAFPCIGNSTKDYCAGYHDGGIQAYGDYKTGNDLDVDQHRCTSSTEYCNGYNRGYSDETDFLG